MPSHYHLNLFYILLSLFCFHQSNRQQFSCLVLHSVLIWLFLVDSFHYFIFHAYKLTKRHRHHNPSTQMHFLHRFHYILLSILLLLNWKFAECCFFFFFFSPKCGYMYLVFSVQGVDDVWKMCFKLSVWYPWRQVKKK